MPRSSVRESRRQFRRVRSTLATARISRIWEPLERHLVFWPERTIRGTPAHVGLDFDDVELIADDGVRTRGWFVPGRSGLTLLWLHGNGGNLSTRLEHLRQLHRRIQANSSC